MSNSIGKIEQLTGKATVVSPDGESSPAVAGMAIATDSVVTTEAGSAMIIKFSDGTTMNIGADEFVLIDKTVSDSEELAIDETQAEVDTLKAILAESPDLSVFEETASGEAVAVGGSSLIIDSIEKHNDNSAASGSSSLDQFASNKLSTAQEDDDRFGLSTDTSAALVSLNNILTNDNTPNITGTVNDPTAVIVVSVGGNDYTATNNGDGTWTLPVTNPITDGTTNIVVVATDPAGNETTETAEITVDTVGPIITINPVNTNDTTPTIGGTISENDATIVVTIGGTDYDATNNGDSTWTLPITETLLEGDNEITVVATDPAGNETTEVVNLIVDITAPIVNIDAIHTNDATPEITGTINDSTATVIVNINGTDYPATNNGDGTWTLPDNTISVLPENVDISITVTATDVVGNETIITDTFVVDTILDDDDNDNGGNVVTIDSITEDTGESNSDFITNDATLIIRGTYDNEDENVLAIKIDGVLVDSASIIITNKQWKLNLENTPFDENTHTIEAIVTDDAGNEKSIIQNIVIDTSGTGDDGNGTGIDGKDATVILDEISDDYINLEETLSGITVTGETTLLDGGEVVVSFNGKTYTTTATGGDLSGTPNTFSLTIPTEDLVDVNDGTYIVTASVIADKAGNIITDTEDVTIDTSNSDNNGNGNTDNGADATITLHDISDNYINLAETSENLVITGTSTAKVGSSITIEVTGGDGVAHNINEFLNPDPVIKVDASGNFSVTFIATAFSAFADGNYTVSATVIADNAGNTITDTQEVVLDTSFTDDDGDFPQGNGNLITIDSITEDTGSDTTDFITSDNKLIISGSFDNETANRILSVTVDGTAYNVITSTDTADKSWSVDLTNVTLSDGEHTVIATIADEAGNTQTATEVITIDTTPANADAIVLDEISNNYINAIEHDQTLTISGSVGSASNVGDAVSIDFNNITYNTLVVADVNGALRFSIDIPVVDVQALADDTIYTATATTSTATQTVVDTEDVTVDLTLTAGGNNGELITIDGITEDTGISDSDFITNDTTIIISGTYDNSADTHGIENVLTITIDGQLYAPTLNGTDWSIDLTNTVLSDGNYELVATLSDAAGNTTTETQTITIDTTVNPTEDDATILLNEISDNVINADEASSSTLTVISGTTTAAENQMVSIKVNGLDFATTLVTANGTFSVNIPQGTFDAYTDGSYTVTASVMADAAGNIVSDDQLVILDTTLGSTSNDFNSVSESALNTGTDTSATGRVAQGNLLSNDTIDSDVSITALNIGSSTSTILVDNADILVLDTPDGVMYVATANTSLNGIDYSAGDYYYELQEASSDVSETITYTVSDSVGNTTTSDLTILIEDDVAIGQVIDKYLVETVNGFTTNLVLVLDTSGSMGGDRLQLMKDAVNNMIDAYAIKGDVNIKVINFDDDATTTRWYNSTEIGIVQTDIQSMSAGGGTDYDTAIEAVMNNYERRVDGQTNGFFGIGSSTTYTSDPAPDANETQVYFLSDGEPTGSDGGFFGFGGNPNELDSNEQTEWANFIASIDAEVHAVGIGSGTDTNELKTISSPNNPSGTNDPIIVLDQNDLAFALIDTISDGHITGNILVTDNMSSPIILGADGGHVTKLEMLDANGDPIPGAFKLLSDADANGNVTMTTPLNAIVTINFETGTYDYQLDVNNTNFGASETVKVTAETTDGQIVTGIFTLHIDTPSFDGNDTILYDNSSTFNDGGLGFDTIILQDIQDLDFSNISNIQNIEAIDLVGADHSITNLTAQEVIDMTDSDNTLFIYGDSGDNVAMDNTLADTGTTTVVDGKTFDIYADAGNTVTVNIEQEIIVS